MSEPDRFIQTLRSEHGKAFIMDGGVFMGS